MSQEPMSLELDAPVTECGETLAGTATWGPLAEVPRRLVVRLCWVAEGQGDSDRRHLGEVAFDGSASGSEPFELDVPAGGPISYDGNLFQVRWEVELRLDRRLRADPSVAVPVTVLPRGGLALLADRAGAPPPPEEVDEG